MEREETLARQLLKRVSYWTGGHPYLTQRLCHAIAEDPTVRSAKGVDLHGRFLAVKYHLNDLVHFYVWDIARREAILRVPDGVHDGAMEFSPDNRSVVAGRSDGTVHLYGLSSRKESKRLFSGPPAYHLRFDPTGRRLAISSRHSSTVQIRDKETGTIIAGFEHPGLVRGIAWSRGGELLATACADFRVYVWNISTGKTQSVLEGHQAEATSVVFNHRGDLLVSTSWDSRSSSVTCCVEGVAMTLLLEREILPGSAVFAWRNSYPGFMGI